MSSDPPPTVLTQVALDEDARPHFSDAQLREYLERIKIPATYLDSSLLKDAALARTKEHGLPLLQALTRYHACNVPFDNLVLHYSADKTVSLDQTDLYNKIVHRRLGGRCMENNSFFGTVLRSLGYEVRNCGGRVARAMSPYPDVRRNRNRTYDGWNHMLNLVRLDDEWYGVDVGMGSMGPSLPFPLRDGFETTSIPPRLIRLQLRPIAESYATKSANSPGAPKMWCFDICNNPANESNKEWVPVYCFTEMEFLPQDYEMIMDEGEEAIIGSITLFKNTVRKTVGSSRKIIKECKTEEERVQTLADIFGVHLTEEEQNGIQNDKRSA